MTTIEEVTELLDWKHTIFDLYSEVRGASDTRAVWAKWRAVRDELFASHPQSPVASTERDRFGGLDYFAYDPHARVLGTVAGARPETYEIATSGSETMTFTRFGVVTFELGGRAFQLELYWLESYGGGLFVPFRDATSGAETYGAGRYLIDSVKGADLGIDDGRLVLDFNFAYNPSCAYDPKWVCPLVPSANRLEVAVRAGEKNPRPALRY